MKYRRLLFQIEIAKGLPAKDSKNWAPSFAGTVQYHEDTCLIVNIMRSWLGRITKVENEANQEIARMGMEVPDSWNNCCDLLTTCPYL